MKYSGGEGGRPASREAKAREAGTRGAHLLSWVWLGKSDIEARAAKDWPGWEAGQPQCMAREGGRRVSTEPEALPSGGLLLGFLGCSKNISVNSSLIDSLVFIEIMIVVVVVVIILICLPLE